MYIIGFGGEKGVGKTTMIKKILDKHKHEKVILFKSKYGSLPAIKIGKSFILGDYDDIDGNFNGTDRLSMAISVPLKMWLSSNKNKNINIIFEGDRLFTQDIKDYLMRNKIKHKFYILTASKDIIDKQIKQRGHNENPSFVKSRQTKYKNMIIKNNIDEIKQKEGITMINKLLLEK
jgi:guanylate kinase